MAVNRKVRARVPRDILEIATQVIHASGLTVSDVVRALMRRIAQDQIIPLELFEPSAQTLAAFAEIERSKLKRFDSVDALCADLGDSPNLTDSTELSIFDPSKLRIKLENPPK